MSKTGEIRRDEGCVDFSFRSKSPVTFECHGSRGNQEWKYTKVGEKEREERERVTDRG